MPNSNYRKGADYEYRIMRKLRAEGWTCTRSAGSHGYFDVIAIKEPSREPYFSGEHGETFVDHDGQIKLIQAKTGKSKKHAIEKVVMSDIKKRYEGTYQVSVEVC